MGGAWTELAAFLQKPLNTEGNAAQWFLFVGLILVILYIWHAIARDWQRLEG